MKNLLIVAVLLVSGLIVNAQGKTLYVSTEAVFANIPQTKIADSLVSIKDQELGKEYADRKAEIDELVEKFIKDSVTMTETQKADKKKSLQEKYSKLGEFENELKGKLEEYKEKLLTPIRAKILEIIRAVAKAKGVQTVLYRESAVLIPTGSDITEEVFNKMKALKK